jgi:anaerobic magnesium-protoporphyrin IX monomethyl ester cyclase
VLAGLIGLESGDDTVLRHLGKGTTVKQNTEAVFCAHRNGLRVRADFLVGTPWETKKSLDQTLQYAKSLPLDYAHFNKFVPYPGTALYRQLISRGRSISFNRGAAITDHSNFVYVPDCFNHREYEETLNQAHRGFYLRPRYIRRRLASISTLPEFLGQVKGFLSIVRL